MRKAVPIGGLLFYCSSSISRKCLEWASSNFPNRNKVRVPMRETRVPSRGKPSPMTTPTAATNQMVAAVVSPVTWSPLLRMAPAPMKPTPLTT